MGGQHVQKRRGFPIPDHHRHSPRFPHLHSVGNLPRVAYQHKPRWIRARSSTFPFKSCITSRSCYYIYRISIRPGVSNVAAHGRGGSEYSGSRPRERKCQVRSGYGSNGTGMVRLRPPGRCHSRLACDDLEYPITGSTDR